jgi:hypothetical protein
MGVEAAPSRGERRPRAKLASIVALMVLGSVTLWIGSPAFWLWVSSKLQSGTQPTMGPYGLMILGIILTSVAIAMGLSRLNRLYARVSGTDATVRLHIGWLRSLGGEHEVKLRTVTVLDVVMVVSVMIAAVGLAAWFFLVHPTPPGVGPGPAKH